MSKPRLPGRTPYFGEIDSVEDGAESVSISESLSREGGPTYDRILDHMRDALLIDNRRGRVVFANRAFRELFGFDVVEVQALELEDYVAPEWHAELRERHDRRVRGEDVPSFFEYEALRPDGTRFPVEVSVVPVFQGPTIIGTQSVLRDITDRREALQEITEAHRTLKLLLDSLPLAVHVLDLQGRVLVWNQAAERILGWPAEEVLGQAYPLLSSESGEEQRRMLASSLEETAVYAGYETRRRRRDGTDVDVAIWSSPMIDEHGKAYAALAAMADVGARKRAEAALRKSESRYALAARAANDGLWSWRPGEWNVYYSPRWKRLLGFRDDQIGTDLQEWLDRVHPEDRRAVEEMLYRLETGSPERLQVEHRMLQRSGEYRWTLATAVADLDDAGQPIRVAGSHTDIHDRKHFEQRLKHEAAHDALTNLVNRGEFMRRLREALNDPERRQVAVLFVDLDRFKLVNDSLGHLIGDRLLGQVGARLRSLGAIAHTCARIGGDEFGVIVDVTVGLPAAAATASRIHAELTVPLNIDTHEIHLGCNIGIAVADATTKSADELLRNADIAMYRAKARGTPMEMFDAGMLSDLLQRHQMEIDVRLALERNEFVLHYQPVVSMASGAITGFEALVRWEHPERGLLSPGAFLRVCEETRQILPLTQVVLRAACRQAEEWRRSGAGEGPISVSVNLPTTMFAERNLVDNLRRVLDETGLPASLLAIELTETTMMQEPGATASQLEELRGMSVSVYVDDFGTGYSSLAYLRDLPIDRLKIDRSFVSALGRDADRRLTRTIVNLAHDLGHQVVAEGVETQEQLELLQAMDCDFAQGYLLARPVPATEATELLQRGTLFPDDS